MSGESALGTLKAYVANNEGMLFVIAAEGFFALMNLSVKILGEEVSVLEIVLIRMIITCLCAISYMYYAKINDPVFGPPGIRLLLCIRGFTGFLGIFGLWFSLQYLSLSDAIVLTFLTPLCSAAVGSFLLKENFTMKEAFAGIVSLMGVILIARPPFLFDVIKTDAGRQNEKELSLRAFQTDAANLVTTGQRMVAVGIALLGVAAVTCEYNVLRVIGKRAHPFHNIVYLSFFSVLASSLGLTITHTHLTLPSTQKWPLLLLVTLFGLFAQICMILGFQREAVGRASMGVYSGIIFALVLGRLVFGTVPGMLSVVGIGLILGSAVFVVVVKQARAEEGGEGGGEDTDSEVGMCEKADVEMGLLEMVEVEEM